MHNARREHTQHTQHAEQAEQAFEACRDQQDGKHAGTSSLAVLLLVLHVPAPSPTLSPTDPVPRSLLTLWARAGRGALYHASSSSVPPRAAPVASLAYTIAY